MTGCLVGHLRPSVLAPNRHPTYIKPRHAKLPGLLGASGSSRMWAFRWVGFEGCQLGVVESTPTRSTPVQATDSCTVLEASNSLPAGKKPPPPVLEASNSLPAGKKPPPPPPPPQKKKNTRLLSWLVAIGRLRFFARVLWLICYLCLHPLSEPARLWQTREGNR